jgi:acetyl esterase/lipase
MSGLYIISCPLRDVGVEYANKLEEAKTTVVWKHYGDMTHGWLQMTAWSGDAEKCVGDVAGALGEFVYGE